MKNISKILIAFISILAVSCNADDVDNRPILESVSAPEMTLPTTGKEYVLTEEAANNEADVFTWTAAEYSNDVVVTYSLMMDVKDGDFTNAQTLATTNDVTQAAVTVKSLNQAAIELGAVPGTAKLFDVKLKCSVSGGVPMETEETITISVTTYSGLVAYAFTDWYLVGDATVAGWDPNKGNQPLFRSGTNPKLYKYTGYFKVGAFKVISSLGSWIPMYGMGASGTLAYRGTDADADPATFNIATAGYYTFTMNTQTLTYTLVSYDASAATNYSVIGFIGSSRTGTEAGWGDDTDMIQSTFDPHIWTLTISLFDGKGKFRANNAWDVNWGGDTAFSGYTANGASGGDIPVAKSKYKVYFNDLDGSYLMLPNQQ
ncbi:SusE domain-containing protein [Flavobacterium sp. FZUC8N2.13]|uniref:SusE domain-containing protein n=1 Tax=Flavobacterium zubiriense TaxID=3138075 RepID=A0ABV4T901_9FLAO